MRLVVSSKGSKYLVEDKKSRLLYTVKKKGFGKRYILLDSSEYNLYTFTQEGDERKPNFSIILNDNVLLKLECTSMFLDPSIKVHGDNLQFLLKSKDRRSFEILVGEEKVGFIETLLTVAGDLQYEVDIDDKYFDDYIPLFAVALDKAFGDINKKK